MPLVFENSTECDPHLTSTVDIMKSNLLTSISDVIKNRYPHKPLNVSDATKPIMIPSVHNSKLSLELLSLLMLTMDGAPISKELYKARLDVTKSAFSQRRKCLVPEHFADILSYFNSSCDDSATFKGYSVYAVDATTINLPRCESSPSHYKDNSRPRGINQLHATMLYDIMNKTFWNCFIQPQPQMNEISALDSMLSFPNIIPDKLLIVGDRGFEKYGLFAMLNESDIKYLIRVKQEHGAMTLVRHLPMQELDTDVSGTITTTQTKENAANHRIYTRADHWKFPLPYDIGFRVVRIKLNTGEYETLVTNLPRDEITADDIRELYKARWGIELAFREIKYGLNLVLLHGKSDEFAAQEIYAAMIMYNFCSRIASQVVFEHRENLIHEYAVNMEMAHMLCKNFLRGNIESGDELMYLISKFVEPIRPDRSDKRKIRPQGFEDSFVVYPREHEWVTPK